MTPPAKKEPEKIAAKEPAPSPAPPPKSKDGARVSGADPFSGDGMEEPLKASGPAAGGPEVKRALPVETEAPQTQMDFALWQIALERRHFSCGTIDGHFAMRSTRAIREFQANQGLARTGVLDEATRLHLSKPGNPYLSYTVTAADMARIDPTPASFLAKSKKTCLGYNDAWEMLGEKFHSSPDFLKKLNPGLGSVHAGTVLTAPNLETSAPLPKAGKIQIRLSETTLVVRDNSNRVIACFPCSIAKDKNKRPSGQLLVAVVVPDPNYTFNPDVLKEAARKEGITKKLILPPGPNNPVGMAWIGLSLPGYGIHGTPEPAAISRTGSMGCFRLANWNAQKLLRMVSPGVPVEVEE